LNCLEIDFIKKSFSSFDSFTITLKENPSQVLSPATKILGKAKAKNKLKRKIHKALGEVKKFNDVKEALLKMPG